MTGVLAKLVAGLNRRPQFARLFAVIGLAALYPASGAIGNPTFEGVASCAGSTCHGRAEGNGAVVRQDEIATWQEPSSPGGAHSRAYAVLSGRRGQQIAASLGLGNAAQAPACLGCHSTYAPPARRGAKFHPLRWGGLAKAAMGLSGGGWLAEHYALPATHASNVAAGPDPARQCQNARQRLPRLPLWFGQAGPVS